MGNRAVVTWANKKNYMDSIGVYLHWNGGEESIIPFLRYCEMRHFREPDSDDYGLARFVQVIANFFGKDGLSIGVNFVKRLDYDNGDNGVYLCKGWHVSEHIDFDFDTGKPYTVPRADLSNDWMRDMLEAIDESQPKEQRLGAEYIREHMDEPPF